MSGAGSPTLLAVDRIAIFWYALVFAVCVMHLRELARPALESAFFAQSAAACWILAIITKSWSLRGALAARCALFILILPITFDMVGRVVPYISPDARDSWLLAADRYLFGGDPTRLTGDRERFPWLTEVLQIVYSSFYFLGLILGARLFYLKKVREVGHALLVVVAGFLISYLGYFLIPGRSPYQLFHYPFELRGVFATEWLRDAIRYAEGDRYDAFPSGHSDVAWLVAALAWKYDRASFYVLFLPIAILLPISTIYLRYHYGVDVLAGALFAAATWKLCAILQRGRDGAAQ